MSLDPVRRRIVGANIPGMDPVPASAIDLARAHPSDRRTRIAARRAAPGMLCAIVTLVGAACGGEGTTASGPASHHALRRAPACGAAEALTTVAIIGTRDDGAAFVYCTGSLVAPDAVLVAAHCITETTTVAQYANRDGDLRSLPGADAAVRDATLAASNAVVRSAPNPSYNGGTHAHDVGLMFLAQPFVDAPLAIVLAAEEDPGVEDGIEVAFAGYGYDEEAVFGLKRCATATLDRSDGLHLFVDGSGDAPQGCNGDSGGGLMIDVPTAHARSDRVAGVASYTAPDCATFTAFSDVRIDRDFLDEQLQDCSGRSWCEVPGVIPPGAFDPPAPPQGEGDGDEPGDVDGTASNGDTSAGCSSTPWRALAFALVPCLLRSRARLRRD